MAPPNLQGLNIVHPPQPQNPYLSDQDLLAVPPFSDLTAQLDLWTNLNFQSDEPIISSRDERGKSSGYGGEGSGSRGGKDSNSYNSSEDDLQEIGKVAEAHAHENVVTGTVIPSPTMNHSDDGKNNSPFMHQSLDIQSLLAGFGIDAFHSPALQQPPQANNAQSIAQLLSYHAAAAGLRPAPAGSQEKSASPAPSAAAPASKRARTARAATVSEPQSPVESVDPDDDEKSSGTPLNASEDKRRRNTAASARFRLKKKEREAALEKKAKELEVKVGELEKECEALRRENGWLKGLVVGVTGAGAVQQQQAQSGIKRAREDDISPHGP
ncbi:hypothetical protein EUX98_g4560 [Antrodiella citrinella]|uniref:BZIP domain-containing protein n=1 Tax=Antrodiella citrinella TaxID=2447956 RepID=A0A4S4MVM2_9APHY|nr:hypothetical protein EUX98_g4560 [Antrodiella citrinella]